MFKKLFAALAVSAFGISAALAQGTFVQATWTGVITLPNQHTLVSFHTTDSTATGVYVIAWDAASAPSPGVMASAPPLCLYVGPTISPARSESLGMANTPNPIVVQNGLVVALSSTDCSVSGASYTPISGFLSVSYQ